MGRSDTSRRDVIKKASFIVPAMMSFKLSEMKAYASTGGPTKSRGNSYGNTRPDNNPTDVNNTHDGDDFIRD